MDVLLVEDNQADADLIEEMLGSPGFKLSPVSRLSTALEALEQNAFEAVLLDLGLPDSQGLDTLSRLRAAARSLPIVVSSGLSDEEIAMQAMQLGAQDYVIKGRFDGPLLARTLRYAVARGRVERIVRESEQQYRQLFERHPHPMWVFDPTSRDFLAVNEAALRCYGWSREEFLAMSVEALVPGAARGRLRASIDAALSGETCFLGMDDAWRHRTRSGEELEVELALGPIPFRGTPALLAVATDVTQTRRLQTQLLQARKLEALGQLAGGVAHDFNNTLGVIIGYAELIAGDPAAGRLDRERAERIAQAARQSSALTGQLLAFSRRQVLTPKAVDLNAVIADFEAMLQRLLGDHVQVVTNLGQDVGRVCADPVQLQQVLLNLAANARDAMPQGGTLVIETSDAEVDAALARTHTGAREGPYVALVVADTGQGMDEETLAHLFEPFYTTKPEGEGTGLGLATVYGIVQQSGGFLEVQSEVGHGTIFRVFLPRTDEAPETAARDEPSPVPSSGGSETILLVEDTYALRVFLREILENAGYSVLEASGPDAALKLAGESEEPIHLLITDLMMRGLTGSQLASRLAKSRPETKVLYISGYDPDLLETRRALPPGSMLLSKPFSTPELLHEIRRLLDTPGDPPS